MGHLYHGYVSHNQRVYLQTSEKNIRDFVQPSWIDRYDQHLRCSAVPQVPQPLSAQPPTPSATPKERLDGHASDASGSPSFPRKKGDFPVKNLHLEWILSRNLHFDRWYSRIPMGFPMNTPKLPCWSIFQKWEHQKHIGFLGIGQEQYRSVK
jgi:hypothetical protein